MSRFMNMIYAVEVLNGRLNTSAPEVEKTGGYDNITFTKKVAGKGYSSAVSIKKNIKRFYENEGYEIAELEKVDKKLKVDITPHSIINQDIMGFMMADKEVLNKEQYDELDEEVKKLYKKTKKSYERNITKKRVARLQLNGLIGTGQTFVKQEFGVCQTTGDSMPYKLETYSDMMVGLANFDIENTSKFIISDSEKEYRDYNVEEAEVYGVKDLDREEKIKRIEATLRGIQYLSMKSNQSNYLVDTTPKIVIIGEYTWGNNVFQGIINKDGINIYGLKETLDENERFRNSNIYIGFSSRIQNENFKDLKDTLSEEMKDYDYVEIGTVGDAFDKYIKHIKETV